MPPFRSERGYRGARARGNPYVYHRKPAPPPPPPHSVQNNIPTLMSSSLITIVPSVETKEVCTQTITRDRNLDPINFARLYISTQISGHNIEEKRSKFFQDETLNENIRKSYRRYLDDHGNVDPKSTGKLTKVDRKYHLIDRTLRSKIEQMTPDQIKKEYPGIGWDYLGLQARMEYQLRYCTQLTEADTDERFFQDKTILTNLKIGYSRWKSENISSSNHTVLHIDKSSHNQSQSIESQDDAIPVTELLPDITLSTNLLSMSLEEIEAAYGSVDKDILGLQARIEYSEEKADRDLGGENVHNLDIDFMLDEYVPQFIRSWYRNWLTKNQLIKRQNEFYVVGVYDAKSETVQESHDVPNGTV